MWQNLWSNHSLSVASGLPVQPWHFLFLLLIRLWAFTFIIACKVAVKWNLCQVWLNAQRRNCPKAKRIKHWFSPLILNSVFWKKRCFSLQSVMGWYSKCSSWSNFQVCHKLALLLTVMSSTSAELYQLIEGTIYVFYLTKLLNGICMPEHSIPCLSEYSVWVALDYQILLKFM